MDHQSWDASEIAQIVGQYRIVVGKCGSSYQEIVSADELTHCS